MSVTDRPSQLIDPVCGMAVDVMRAEAAGLLVDLDGRTFAFCRDGCRRAFVMDPVAYAAAAPGVSGHPHPGDHEGSSAGLPIIDEGMRRWYESCSCCLSEAYPDIKAQLDAERAAERLAEVARGICEVAEAG